MSNEYSVWDDELSDDIFLQVQEDNCDQITFLEIMSLLDEEKEEDKAKNNENCTKNLDVINK